MFEGLLIEKEGTGSKVRRTRLDDGRLPDGDVLLLPAIWPVRLTPEQQQALAQDLLDSATPTSRS